MKVTFDKEKSRNEDFAPFTIMRVPLSDELVQDCYMFNAIDAPSEMKFMVLEEVAKSFDEYVLANAPTSFRDTEWLKNKLNTIEIKYKV